MLLHDKAELLADLGIGELRRRRGGEEGAGWGREVEEEREPVVPVGLQDFAFEVFEDFEFDSAGGEGGQADEAEDGVLGCASGDEVFDGC